MLFSTNLLKKYISLDIDPKDLMSTMTLHACEIEHVDARKIADLVVIGYVTETCKHPNADTLTICQLDCGNHGMFQICTAADNIIPNIYVPVALPGCYLSAIDLTIGSRQMRGEDSNGMICAKIELGINEDVDQHGIWILDQDFADLEKTDIGRGLADKYAWLDNMMLDVDNKTINNRPDLTGLLGMAIEMRAIFRNNNTLDVIKQENIAHVLGEHNPVRTLELLNYAKHPRQDVRVETSLCSVYSLVQIDSVIVRNSSFYDRLSLIDSGLGTKNNWVDFTNLFATLIGQPVHAFDADTIKGTIIVRQAHDSEQFVDLFGTTHTLVSQDIVIADDGGVIALAGVVGGKTTGISDTTKNIIIEIAHFDPVAVRRTSMRIGLRTDAVMRFEKTLSPLLSLTALSMMLDILEQYKLMLGDYTLVGMSSVIDDATRTKAQSGQYISFDPHHCVRLLFGCELTEDNEQMMKTMLEVLGFVVNAGSSENFVQDAIWQVKVPRRRGSDDMNIAEDLYEEVARLYGYNRIEPMVSTEPVIYKPFVGVVAINRIVEQILVATYHADQLQTYPRNDDMLLDIFAYDRRQLVQIRNAVSPELSYLRPSMIPNLLLAVAKNSKIYPSFTLFDSGQTRNKSETFSRYLNKQSFETTKIGLVSYKKSVSDRKEDALLEMKAMLESIVSACGGEGTIEYIPTNHPYYHPKKQGEIVFVPSVIARDSKDPVDRQDVSTSLHSAQHDEEGEVIGMIAQIHPTILETLKIESTAQVVVAELYLETIADLIVAQGHTFQSDADYQTIQDQILLRDLAFVIDSSESVEKVIHTVQQVAGVQEVALFDLYAGEHLPEGKKSIALTLTIKGDGSWTTDQINAVMNTAIAEVEKIGGKLR